MIERLILNGSLEVAGVDLETNELLYNFTDKLQVTHPSLYNEFVTFFSQETLELWEHGFLEMDMLSNNPSVRLTEKALDDIEVAKLDKQKQFSLKEIIRILYKD